MNIFREIPPTAGLPVYFKDFLSVFKAGSLEDDFKSYLGVCYAQVTYSGTAALYFILETLKTISKKTTVVIPSFICPLLPLAIKRAGLKVEVCDICKDRFDFDLMQLEKLCAASDDILAIIVVHLAGIPLDFEEIEKIAKIYSVFTIEDCAQAQGAQYKNKKVGALGDFSFFSLCRGKGMTIYEGGVACAKKEYSQGLRQTIGLLAKNNFFSEGLKILELFGYWIFYRPLLFWFVFSLPKIFWNLSGNKLKAQIEYFSINFPIHRVSNFRKSVGRAMFNRLKEQIDSQRQKAAVYLKKLDDLTGVRAVKELPGTKATYPYLALIFADFRMRDKIQKLLEGYNLGVSQIYACAITDYDYLKEIIPGRNCPNARFAATHSLTLSTSVFLKEKDIGDFDKLIKINLGKPEIRV